jgi:hypothetical protein
MRKFIVSTALAVVFLVSATVQADIERGTDVFLGSGYGLVELFSVTLEKKEGSWSVVDGGWDYTGLAAVGDPLDVTPGLPTNKFPLRDFVLIYPADDVPYPYLDFVVSLAGDTNADGLTINGDAIEGIGNYFYGLLAVLNDTGELDFRFASVLNSDATQFVFAGYGVVRADSPEPATLALMGFGLAGLGLARRRMKK